MRISSIRSGFLQALGVAIYVACFALSVNFVGSIVDSYEISPGPVFGIIAFLLAFIVSALITGSIMLWRPVSLFLSGKRHEAVEIIFWSVIWLIAFLALVGLVSLAIPKNL